MSLPSCLTLRTVKGSVLSWVELDNNFICLNNSINNVASLIHNGNMWHIPSGDTVTIETDYQHFIYGDMVIEGTLQLSGGSQLVVLNGDLIFSGGSVVGPGTIYNIQLPEFDTKVTGVTYTGDVLTIYQNDGTSYSATTPSFTFTGNTSGSCITDLYITNLHGCSPITVWDNLQTVTSTATGLYSNTFGSNNTVSGLYTTIAGGFQNTSSGDYNFIGGGEGNTIMGSSHTIIGGGYNNFITGATFSSILSGRNNRISGVSGVTTNIHVIGSNITATTSNTTYVNSLNIKTVGGGTSVNNLGIDINGFVVTGSTGVVKYSTTLTTPSGGTHTITHSLGSTDISVTLWLVTTGDMTSAQITNRLTNSVDVVFSSPPGEDVRVVVLG